MSLSRRECATINIRDVGLRDHKTIKLDSIQLNHDSRLKVVNAHIFAGDHKESKIRQIADTLLAVANTAL